MLTGFYSRGANDNALWFLIITSVYMVLSIYNSLGTLEDIQVLGSRIYGILLMPNITIIAMFILASVILESSNELDKININSEEIHPFSKIMYFTVLGAFLAGPAGTVGSCMILLAGFGKTLMQDPRIPARLVIGLILVIATMGQLVPPAVLPIMINDVMTNTVQNFWFSKGVYEFDIAPSIDLMNALYAPSLIVLALIIGYVITQVQAPAPAKFAKDFFSLIKRNWLFIGGIVGLSTASIFNLINVYEFGMLFILLGLIVTFVNQQFCAGYAVKITHRTAAISGVVLTFLLIGNLIAFVFQLNGNYDAVIEYFDFNDLSAVQTHLIYIGHLLFLGMFVDPFEITYVFLPFTSNIMLMQGYDTVYIGALSTLVMQVAYLTPPVGLGLFYLKALFTDLKLKDIVVAAIPFVGIQVIGIILYIGIFAK